MTPVFQAGGALPVDHSTYVERRADHDALRAALNGEYLHVIAPRQVGKTSLLKRLSYRLEDMGWRCAYLDLAPLMDLPKSDWYTELGKALAEALTPGDFPKLTNQIVLRNYLLNRALPWPDGYPCIALILDEVEGAGKARDIDGNPFSDTFFMTLRNLYQVDDHKGRLVVALAGAVNPDELVKDPDISPFNVGREVELDDFTPTETQSLISHLEDLGVDVDGSVHQVIYNWISGHPYLTQRTCAELERSIEDEDVVALTSDHVDRAVEQIINPINPLQQDKNLRHVAKMLDRLSAPASELWSRLQAGECVPRRETPGEVFLELYLTGAIKAQAENLVIRNRVYAFAFGTGEEIKTGVTCGEYAERTLTPEGRDYARELQSAGREAHPESSKSLGKGGSMRIFLSSTWKDLQPEREAVEEALHRMQGTLFVGMEYFGSRPDTPREASLAEVDRSDIYIGIFAHRYGSGITEAEYRRARERGIPCLIYLKDDTVPVVPKHMERIPGNGARQEDLKRELKEQHTVSFFKGPDHLATQVVTDLHNLVGATSPVEKESSPEARPKYQITVTNAQGVAIGDQAKVVQRLDSPLLAEDDDPDTLRLEQLTDNIHQDLALLKEYEDALRYEDDPRRRARYRREIEQLRESAARYQRKYQELKARGANESPRAMRHIASQLHKMDAKLDGLMSGQSAIRQDLCELHRAILSRFQASQQSMIAAILDRLDRAQLETVQTVLDGIETTALSETEMKNALAVLQEALGEIRNREALLADRDLADKVKNVSQLVEAPRLDVKNKIKIAMPIIPLLLAYEGEIELGSTMNLEAAWQQLVARIRGRR